jgi:hypothetical protein
MNTDCTKCSAAWRPIPGYGRRFFTTAYRCQCGHWNDLKRRKGYAEYVKAIAEVKS